MSTAPVDFSDLGGKPVQASSSGSIDFSDLGGKPVSSPPRTATAYPEAQISAQKQPDSLSGKVEQWATNVSNDIKYGTDTTGVGTVLKKMGAHGVYAGNPEAVGDFMASLPLGLAKMTQGGAQIPQGRIREGAGNVLGGALQAATIPGAFVAPEAGEMAAAAPSKAIGMISGQAAKEAAGGLFKAVDQAATDANLTVDASAAADKALRIWNSTNLAGSKPQFVQRFLNRVTAPDASPLTYQEARDLYSNVSRLSVDEMNRLTPKMKMMVGDFVRTLDGSIRDAAASIGQGENYSNAMKGFATGAQRAERFSDFKDVYGPAAAKGAAYTVGGTAAGGTLYSLYNWLVGKGK